MTRPIKKKYEIIENALDKITKKPGTKSTYRSYINRYFKILGVENPNSYLTSNRNYTDDIWTVAKEIENIPAKTQQTFVSAVKRFLRRLDVDIKAREWEDISSRNELTKVYALTDDVIPKSSQLKQLLQLSTPKIKILVLFLATTGCRLNEALQITWKDVDMDKRKVKLSGEITKSSMKRFTFFTEETKDALEAWKIERHRFITHSMKKSIFVRNQLAKDGFEIKKKNDKWVIYKDGKRIDREKVIELDQRVFPFSSYTAQASWITLLEKAGMPFNEKDNNPKFDRPRYRFHIHCLRKFWFHSFQNTGANKNHIDFMGGHQSLLDATYTDFLSEPDKL
ncbi:MAG: site-specific integrase, partial [Thermoplasmatales archaeon]|nr:site-specific integrase [Thermoplasmatales archaeon]